MGDYESSTMSEKELKRRKRIRLAIYISIFVVFQIIVIAIFSVTVLKAKTPKFRLSEIEIQSLNTNTSSLAFTTKVKVKNSNFGAYKYDNSTIAFTYQGSFVGQVVIEKGKAGWLTTKNIEGVQVNLNSQALPTAGDFTLNSNGKMTGKVDLIGMIKKKKSTEMDCTIGINVEARTVRSLECK
nr:late embryogenesis abundant protein At1g64065-like [Ziziphus jujuba var. spinosa]